MRLSNIVVASALLAAGGCQAQTRGEAAPGAGAAPAETRAANAPSQSPAFPGQTRAPAPAPSAPLATAVVAEGLDHPWGLAELPDGRWLVTERPGRLRLVSGEGLRAEPVAGLPAVDARGQGGLFDVALSPTFATDRLIYWTYAEPREGGNGTAVARGRLSEDLMRVEAVQVIFHAMPTYDGDKHFGGRIAFDREGRLFLTLGDRSDRPMRPQAQDLGSHMGKTIRINADGSVPADNPFVGR
ncbi:MAG TPA: PQQ-dependent sugar dehydrogenase, partial [Caulobacteraceae bacterium]